MSLNTAKGNQIPVNVVGSSTFGKYNKISSAKTYNQFISDEWLVPFPGWSRVHEFFPTGEGRGIFRSIRGNILVVVINQNVYTLDTSLTPTTIGTLATSSGEVSIDENLNSQICIVDGTNAYIYNYSLAPNLTIQSLSFIPNYVTYHNTFFLFGNGTKTGSGSAWYAYIYDTTTTIVEATPGQFALQTKPDYAIAVKRIPGQAANVLVFGSSVCEVFTQQGGIINYRRNNTISVDYGCLNVSTIDSSDHYIAWLSVNENNSPVIMVYSGQGAIPISTDGIDYQLSKIQVPSDSTASFVRVDGHLFYQLTFYNDADNVTFAYDFTTEKFFNLSDQSINHHPAVKYAYFNQNLYFVSLNNGSLYQTSTDFTYINEIVGNTDPTLYKEMQYIRITDTFMQEDSDKFIVNYFEFVIEQGNDPRVTGLSINNIYPLITEDAFPSPNGDADILTEQGVMIVDQYSWGGNPAAMLPGPSSYTIPYRPRVDLSISLDSGITWSEYVQRPLNPVGKRKNILNWRRLGACNAITFKIRFWGTSRFVANMGLIEVKV